MIPLQRHDPLRGGFLILMLIAFTSIILGLSVTFYLYCKRGMDDSHVAVRIVQRRLALQAAINALYSAANLTPYATGVTVDLDVPGLPRTRNLGWYRIRQATAAYSPAPVGIDLTKSVFVTAGSGPSNGVPDPPNFTASWRYEYRVWYLVEMNASVAPMRPKQILPVFPPPAGQW
jgi:hypothetical protein